MDHRWDFPPDNQDSSAVSSDMTYKKPKEYIQKMFNLQDKAEFLDFIQIKSI